MLHILHCSGNQVTTKLLWSAWKLYILYIYIYTFIIYVISIISVYFFNIHICKIQLLEKDNWCHIVFQILFNFISSKFRNIFSILEETKQRWRGSWSYKAALAGKGLARWEISFNSCYDTALKEFINEPAAGLCWRNLVGFVLQLLAGDSSGQRTLSLTVLSSLLILHSNSSQVFVLCLSRHRYYFSCLQQRFCVSDISLWCTRKMFFIVVIYSRWQRAWFWFHSDCTTLLFMAKPFLFFHSSYHAIIFIPCFSS